MRNSVAQFAMLFAVCLIGASVSAQTVDPLPKYMENASLEEQAAYLEKIAVAAHEEKIAVGKARYAERVANKESLALAARTRADNYIREVREQKEKARQGRERSKSSIDFFFNITVLLSLTLIVAFGFYYRHALLHLFNRK